MQISPTSPGGRYIPCESSIPISMPWLGTPTLVESLSSESSPALVNVIAPLVSERPNPFVRYMPNFSFTCTNTSFGVGAADTTATPVSYTHLRAHETRHD